MTRHPAASPPARRARGVSLVEALVALAVMSIGMLGLVGVQSSLRANSDAAKQRSEAVRLAQEAIEEWRAFVALDATAGVTDYEDLVVGTTTETNLAGSNAEFTRTRTVSTLPAPQAGKSLHVDVSWVDRNGEPQSVRLSTLVAGISPALPATLGVPGDGDSIGSQPQGRHRGIPRDAVALVQRPGRSGFVPPGPASGVVWVFDNASALIELCTTNATSTAQLNAPTTTITCGGDYAVLLSGFLRYALGSTQPLPADAADPPSSPNDLPGPLQVWVRRSAPSALDVQCRTENVATPSLYTAYYCAVPVVVVPNNPPPAWSGRVEFLPSTVMAATLAETSPLRVKACRYFANATYAGVSSPRTPQTSLFIRAGTGAAPAFTCPSPTLAHQPTT